MTDTDTSTTQPGKLLVGDDLTTPGMDGRQRRYVNLDAAASTPALRSVHAAVEEFVPWYSSVHRGAGYKSQLSTAAHEGARESVAGFIDAPADDAVVFVRNTTEAINLLAAALEPGTRVLSSPFEHHANMLPWRQHRVSLLPFVDSQEELLDATRTMLANGNGEIRLVALTGATNVTGDVWPIESLAELVHAAGAELLIDGAQLVPHRPVSMRDLGIDYLAFSGHKLYAPYGAGVLVGRVEHLLERAPLLQGGGAISSVTLDKVSWAGLPSRCEAGSPNTIGAIALGAACDALADIGMDNIAEHERQLASHLWSGLKRLKNITPLRAWPEGTGDRLGLETFIADGMPAHLVSTVLGCEHGIGVRSGRFCAHPFVSHLLQKHEIDPEHPLNDSGKVPPRPGAIRASLSIDSSADDVDRLLEALDQTVRGDIKLDYLYDAERNEYRAEGQSWAWPDLPFRLA